MTNQENEKLNNIPEQNTDINIIELERRVTELSEQVSMLSAIQAQTNTTLSKILIMNKWSLILRIMFWIMAIVATFGFYYYAEYFFQLFGIDISFIKKLYLELGKLSF